MTSQHAGQPSSATKLSELLGWLAAWPPAEESLTASCLADLLWLARTMPEAPRRTIEDQDNHLGEENKERHERDRSSEGSSTRHPPPPLPLPQLADHQPPAFFPEAPAASPRERAAQVLPDRVLPRQRELDAAIASLPVRLQAPRLLAPERMVLEALRPLMGQVPVAGRQHLDEEVTAERCAEHRLPLPVFGSRAEPRFSVTLLVDRGLSMEVWQPLAVEFRDVLVRSGAFREVRMVELLPPRSREGDGAVGVKPAEAQQVVWKSPDTLRRSPPPLAAEASRSLLLVISDTAGPHWWGGLMFEVVAGWRCQLPVASVHTLPSWMAQRTALRGLSRAEIRNDQPIASSSHYLVRDPDGWDHTLTRAGAVPVLSLDPGALAPWAALVMGDGRHSIAGVRIPADRASLEQRLEPLRPASLSPDVSQPSSAEDLWLRFCRSTSPEAQRLMMVLAAAPVLSLPVMRLIKEALLPEASGPLPLQEVLLSGLLQPIAGSPDQPPVDDEIRQYSLHPGVLELLRSDLSTVDTLTVVRMVTALLERRWNALGTGHRFRALLRDPDLEIVDEDLKGVVNFATATADLIERLPGEEYQRFARQLRGRSPQMCRRRWPASMQFVGHSFTTATLVDIPELECIRFETARLENMPLEPIPNANTLGFREPLLTADFTLVQIPEGTFQMGSPPGEPERFDNEGPQHEVQLQGFFLSQTPITQAQWREVAQWQERPGEHWGRELAAEPSFFQPRNQDAGAIGGDFSLLEGEATSDQRPVECVSWEDAMEFCNRLSQRTGRFYTLPSEAQWEYGCRAGSSTPFHVGATITPDLANYAGSISYGDGPEGVNRKQTTPVGLFPANAWGLQDMHGNVWEWCLDHWHGNYEGAPSDGSAWVNPPEQNNQAMIKGGSDNSSEEAMRLLRGGSWLDIPRVCRSAARYRYRPGLASNGVGFRVVCLPQDPSLNA